MIGYNLITHQTTKKGLQVKAVLIDDVIKIKRELYNNKKFVSSSNIIKCFDISRLYH